jgi:hypothetical protein
LHPREVDAHFSHGTVVNYWGGSSNATTHLLEEMHYAGLVRVVRPEAGIRIYSAREPAPQPPHAQDGRVKLDALVDVAVRVYAPRPAAGLSQLVSRLRYGWAICDGICFHLFDKTLHAWRKVDAWASRREEFVRRAAFALLAALALHDRRAPDERFLAALPFVEHAASDERNFVKKGVSWALRGIGSRRAPLHTDALELAQQLAASDSSPAGWVGRDAARDLI